MKKILALVALIALLGANFGAQAAPPLAQDNKWTEPVNAALKNADYNQINVIGASHPDAQGAIAVYLLQASQQQQYASNPARQVKVFAAATPFVGRIPAADANKATEVISAMLKVAANEDFQKSHPQEAAAIFLNALNMSGQPNVVAHDPNLHAEVLEAANDFIKAHPQDVDKKLLEEVSLAEAGGAPETAPKGVINPSAE